MPPQTEQISPVSGSQVPTVKIGKFKASKTIVMESWKVMMLDKEIMWFPVISTISTILAILVIGTIFFMASAAGLLEATNRPFSDIFAYGLLLIGYTLVYFVINFFQAGLFFVVQGRFTGQNLSLKDGINSAQKQINKILLWSLVLATVGLVLQIIASKSKIIGSIVSSILGAAWNILTYFSLPALVIGNLDVKESFKESANIMKKTWGEAIIVNFGVGLFFGVITFLLIALSIGIIVLVPTFAVIASVITLFVIAIIIMTIISSTLSSIFKLALFDYARTGRVPQGFSEDIIKNTIKSKN